MDSVPSGPTHIIAKSGVRQARLKPELLIQIHDNMVKTRVLEERLIKMYKQSDGYFWIGGPGEEAFNVCLGLQGKIGRGLDYDFWHLHYRSSGVCLPMGLDPMDAIRQMKNTATDPFSGGRNFINHFSNRDWNLVPISSPIEVQYAQAIGTGIAHRRHGGEGVTVVTGGDAGTAEGEFASCLIWASRPGQELPMLIVVTNNSWGISTSGDTVRVHKDISERGKAFGMKTMTVNGRDVIETWSALEEAFSYIRSERKPVLMEAKVSRLYGHSSASGANFVTEEIDPIKLFEDQLEKENVLSRTQMDKIRKDYETQMLEMAKKVKEEPMPDGSSVYDYTYHGQRGRYW